ncbi:TonB family protein [Psychrobacter sp. M13]|uniref:TonB family protein n=1 Tax=Psychrobacter sp. M13 TaxID=3067275 RepID=UPI00273BD347|nr:TonB family protein [Psychrobacter sp. M13]WLP93882.1 TonB family protein [Psychrobacter sp. M13]
MTPPIEIQLLPPPPVEIEEVVVKEIKEEPVKKVKIQPKAKPVAAAKPKIVEKHKAKPVDKLKPTVNKTVKQEPTITELSSLPTDTNPTKEDLAERARILNEARESKERESKERESKERESKEREAKEREAKEREAKEREAKEREAKEREAKEREAKEREAKEREAKEREAAAQPVSYGNIGKSSWSREPKFTSIKNKDYGFQGFEASISVSMSVDSNGNIGNIRKSKSSGNNEFDRDFIRALSKAKLHPATRGNNPTKSTATFTFRMNL